MVACNKPVRSSIIAAEKGGQLQADQDGRKIVTENGYPSSPYTDSQADGNAGSTLFSYQHRHLPDRSDTGKRRVIKTTT